MEIHLIPITADAQLAAAQAAAERYLDAALASATRRAYRSDWRQFIKWCGANGRPSLPASPETLALYLSSEAARHRPSTLSRWVAAIGFVHIQAGLVSPALDPGVRRLLAGVRRVHGMAPTRKRPLTVELLENVLPTGSGLRAVRDRALLLVGFAGALRRSELVALQVEDVEEAPQGYVIRVRRSKTDQGGVGSRVGILRGRRSDPVRALERWLTMSGIVRGPIFRSITRGGRLAEAPLSPYSVSLILKKALASAGLAGNEFGAHSLRAGFLTSAARRVAPILRLMEHTRHQKVDTARAYVREVELFDRHPGEGLL